MSESYIDTEALPAEITLTAELLVNEEGKKYAYEKGGVYYGGDYLPETPGEIDLDSVDDLPLPPSEKEYVL